MVQDARMEISGGYAIVSVLAAGRIVYCTQGFRAERMRLLAVLRANPLCDARDIIGHHRRIPLSAQSVADEYGIPALEVGDFERYSTEFGTRHTLDTLLAEEDGR
jgi:hypothetical protein